MSQREPTALDKLIDDPTEHQGDDVMKGAARRELKILRELCEAADAYCKAADAKGNDLEFWESGNLLREKIASFRQWIAEQEK